MYNLKLNETQARIICNALDLYTRVGMGQLEAIGHEMWHFGKSQAFHEKLPDFKKAVTGFDRGSSYGIHQKETPEHCRTAYDIIQVVRHKLAWDKHPDGGQTVDFYPPMKTGKEDLPECKKE